MIQKKEYLVLCRCSFETLVKFLVVRIQQKEYLVLCRCSFETLGELLLFTTYITSRNMPTCSAEKWVQLGPTEILVSFKIFLSGYSEILVSVSFFFQAILKF